MERGVNAIYAMIGASVANKNRCIVERCIHGLTCYPEVVDLNRLASNTCHGSSQSALCLRLSFAHFAWEHVDGTEPKHPFDDSRLRCGRRLTENREECVVRGTVILSSRSGIDTFVAEAGVEFIEGAIAESHEISTLNTDIIMASDMISESVSPAGATSSVPVLLVILRSQATSNRRTWVWTYGCPRGTTGTVSVRTGHLAVCHPHRAHRDYRERRCSLWRHDQTWVLCRRRAYPPRNRRPRTLQTMPEIPRVNCRCPSPLGRFQNQRVIHLSAAQANRSSMPKHPEVVVDI